jgi:hypothetical protein
MSIGSTRCCLARIKSPNMLLSRDTAAWKATFSIQHADVMRIHWQRDMHAYAFWHAALGDNTAIGNVAQCTSPVSGCPGPCLSAAPGAAWRESSHQTCCSHATQQPGRPPFQGKQRSMPGRRARVA